MAEDAGEITELLNRWRQGGDDAANQLFDRIHKDLRRLAQYLMRGERKNHSLQATELVDQIYIRLIAAKDRDWQNRQHFFAIAARAMRRHLIDQARAREQVEMVGLADMQGLLRANSTSFEFAITVDRLLDQLSKHHPEWCSLVELKYFLGLTDEEAAEVLGVKLRTMQRMWREARQWLFEEAERGHAAPDGV